MLEDGQDDAGLVVLIGGDGAVDRRFDGLADVAHPDRRAVAIGEDDVVELLGRGDLIVGGDGEADLVGIDRSFGRIGGGGDERAADLFQRDAGRCELGRVDLDADRRRRVAEDRDLGDAGHLRYLLGEEEVAVIVDRGHRHRVRAQREHDDGRVGRVDLLVARRRGHRLRQGLARDRDRRLHVLPRRVDVAIEIELNDDRGGAERAQGRELGDSRNLRELPLERRGDRGGHGLRACALERGGDLNGGKVHLRQGSDRQKRIGDQSHERQRRHQQRGCDRPANEWFGDVHELPADPATCGEVNVTGALRWSRYCPSVTTRSPPERPEVTIVRLS